MLCSTKRKPYIVMSSSCWQGKASEWVTYHMRRIFSSKQVIPQNATHLICCALCFLLLSLGGCACELLAVTVFLAVCSAAVGGVAVGGGGVAVAGAVCSEPQALGQCLPQQLEQLRPRCPAHTHDIARAHVCIRARALAGPGWCSQQRGHTCYALTILSITKSHNRMHMGCQTMSGYISCIHSSVRLITGWWSQLVGSSGLGLQSREREAGSILKDVTQRCQQWTASKLGATRLCSRPACRLCWLVRVITTTTTRPVC
jgi:hypothetical protein